MRWRRFDDRCARLWPRAPDHSDRTPETDPTELSLTTMGSARLRVRIHRITQGGFNQQPLRAALVRGTLLSVDHEIGRISDLHSLATFIDLQ